MSLVLSLQVLRIAFTICLYFLIFACYLTPVFLTKCWGSRITAYSSPMSAVKARQLGFRYINWCNCVATGIFLGMCFLGLFPYVQEKFVVTFSKMEYKPKFPIPECVIVTGFLVTLFVEQIFLTWQESRLTFFNEDTEQGQGLLEECEMQELYDDTSRNGEEEKRENLVNDFRSDNLDNIQFLTDNSAQSNNSNMSSSYVDSRTPLLLRRRDSRFLFYVIAFATGVHSFFEGITLGLQVDIPKAVHLFTAIVIHESLVGIAMGINSTRLQYSFSKYVKFAIIYSVIVPLGIATGATVIGSTPGITGEFVSAVIQGLSSGLFIHVIFQDFIPALFSSNRDRGIKVFFIFTGFAVMAVITYFISEH